MRQLFKQFRHILNKRQKWELLGLFVLTVIGGFLETFSISVIIPYISIITEPDALSANRWGRYLTALFPGATAQRLLIYLTLGLMIAFFLKNIYLYLLEILQHHFAVKNYYHTSNRLFNIYLSKPYAFFVSHNTSHIITIITSHITKFFNMLQHFLALSTEMVVMVLLLLVLLLTNWQITLFTLILVGCATLLLKHFFTPRLAKVGAASNHQYSRMLQSVQQAFEGIKEIKISHREQAFLDVYRTAGKENIRLEIARSKYSAAPPHIIETLTIWCILIFICFLLLQGSDMSQLFTQLTAMGLVVIRLTPCMKRLNRHLSAIAFNGPAVAQLSDDIEEYLQQQLPMQVTEDTAPMPFNDCIEASHLTFRYPGTEHNILKDVSFAIRRGDRVGIIGASGNGKTTLVDLLMGYWHPTEGTIAVDDTDIHTCLRSWQKHIGYIPQMIFMLDATIFENVAFGYPDADMEDVVHALKQAKLWDYVSGLPEGVHTMIGEKGVRLSGGQRQRIGIARALFQNPDVLIFDEATSALDTELESEITEAIYDLSKEKTILMIAHRHSTLRMCDYVLEVDHEAVIRRETASVYPKD